MDPVYRNALSRGTTNERSLGVRNYFFTLGCCWVMQWMLPPP